MEEIGFFNVIFSFTFKTESVIALSFFFFFIVVTFSCHILSMF